MLKFVSNWLSSPAHPIGISIGQRWIRMAQVERVDGEFRLIAASGIEVVPSAGADMGQRLALFSKAAREALARGDFRGRRAVFAAPWPDLSIHPMRLPRIEEALIEKAVKWETRGKLPTDPDKAIVRHLIAGEVMHENRPCVDVIALGMSRPAIKGLLAVADDARLDVLGIHAEPSALVDCFANIFRRKSDATVVNAFIDIGCASTRIVIAQGRRILHLRTIPLASDDLNRALAAVEHSEIEEAAKLRATLAINELKENAQASNAEILVEPCNSARQAEADRRAEAGRAIEPTVARLANEISSCCQQHAAAFAALPVQRLIFVGGEANDRLLCQSLARQIGIGAQIGDPLVRMARTTPTVLGGGDWVKHGRRNLLP